MRSTDREIVFKSFSTKVIPGKGYSETGGCRSSSAGTSPSTTAIPKWRRCHCGVWPWRFLRPPSLPYPSPLIAEGNGTLPGASPEPPQEDNQSIEVSESECGRECDWEAVSSKHLVHDSDVSVDEAEVTLQESDPSIDLSHRWVLTTEPDEFDKDFVRYGLLT